MKKTDRQTFNDIQQAFDTIIGEYERLRAAGLTHYLAAENIWNCYGVDYDTLSALIARSRMGLYGRSGETVYGSLSTPQRT